MPRALSSYRKSGVVICLVKVTDQTKVTLLHYEAVSIAYFHLPVGQGQQLELSIGTIDQERTRITMLETGVIGHSQKETLFSLV